MTRVRRLSKVTPLHIPPMTTNNFIVKELKIVQQIKYLILVEATLGINRVYLFSVTSFKAIIPNIYCIMLLCFTIYSMFYSTELGTTYLVVKDTLIVEYVTMVILVLTSVKMKHMKFFDNISEFDELLNIQGDLSITSSSKRNFVFMSLCFIYNFCEFYLEMNGFYDGSMTLSQFVMLIVSLTHDIEQIYFLTLLRFTYLRLLIVKAHVVKTFDLDDKVGKNLNKVEELYKRVNLDISSLHRVYELLHRCSSQLNAVMTIPMLLIFFASGISTIMLLKLFVNIFQMTSYNHKAEATIFYLILRCVKHTVLLVGPCYYSSITNTQANDIRATLHDAVNTMPLGKSDRRKVKTFFHLTRESDFSYALCGVIRLNMSLPLSYMSLCTTYLVIIIQFSKFID